MSEIKIEYSEGDEEVKNQIEKFELRKLSDTTEGNYIFKAWFNLFR